MSHIDTMKGISFQKGSIRFYIILLIISFLSNSGDLSKSEIGKLYLQPVVSGFDVTNISVLCNAIITINKVLQSKVIKR